MNRLLTQAAVCINTEDIVLWEISQSRTHIVCFYLCEAPKVVKYFKADSKIMVARA